jgi:diaminohydroxyphosphoribosylaminopyrimidine deaminase/5-amino-6-(5-phosphoribosylamino)uracil reductase
LNSDLKHSIFIERCFQIAKNATWNTLSNPKVGAVIVYQNKIISEGFHHSFGGPHAEVECLDNPNLSKEIIEKSTLYVSLEPCSIYGKTPPCSNKIIESGVKKVVIGSLDPNPNVNGNGMNLLIKNGIEVINLNLIELQNEINLPFIVNQVYGRPYFIGKYSISNNNKMGSEEQKDKITPIELDALFHDIRSGVDGVLIGKNTWRIDKPQLNNRFTFTENQPDVIVLDSMLQNSYENLDIQLNRQIFILNNIKSETYKNIHYVKLDTQNISEMIRFFNSKGMAKILIEGGSKILSFFSDHNYIDELYINKNLKLKIPKGIEAPIMNFTFFNKLNSKVFYCIETKHYQKLINY